LDQVINLSLVFGTDDPAVDGLCPSILKTMIIGDEKTFSSIDLYDLVGVDISTPGLTENDIIDVIIC